MRKRKPKAIQGWGWLGDAAEEAAVEPMAPARPLKNACAARPKKQCAAGRAGVSASHGMIDDDYRQLAKQQYEGEGEIEIDPHGRVSRSEDATGEIGAWVQAWVFVSKPERT